MGLSAGEVAETSAFVIVTFITGLVAVFPLVALLDPSSLETLGISRPAGIAIATLGLLLMAGYVGLGWWIERPIRLFGYRLHLPRPRTAGAQIALSVADLALVAAVLYACLPHASAVGYPHVLAVYVLAFVAGLVSHVPGGLGVFDAVVVVGLSARLPADQILAFLQLRGLQIDAYFAEHDRDLAFVVQPIAPLGIDELAIGTDDLASELPKSPEASVADFLVCIALIRSAAHLHGHGSGSGPHA
jgi:uncharacterized membrane protein YbhN (UPF0104 family)